MAKKKLTKKQKEIIKTSYKKFSVIAIAIIFIVTFAIYANSLKNEFVYDDVKFIKEKESIRDWKNIPKLFTHSYFVLSEERTYRPLVTLSFFVDYSLWKLNPTGWHITNILLHALNGVLVFLLVNSILRINKSETYNLKFLPLATTLLFITHPIQTEAIDGVSFREDLIALFFFLISLLLFIKSTLPRVSLRDEAKQSQNSNLYTLLYPIPYTLSLLFFIFALFSKESSAILPLVIILYDFCFLFKGNIKRIFKDRKYIYSFYFLILIFYIYLTRFSVFYNQGEKAEYPGGGVYPTFLTMSKIFAFYIKLLIIPIRLCADYVFPISHFLFDPFVVISIAILIGYILVGIFYFRRNKIITFSIFFFFVALLPVSNAIPFGALLAERYLYMPSIGFCIILAVCIIKIDEFSPQLKLLARSWKEGKQKPSIFKSKPQMSIKWMSILILMIILTFNFIVTIERNKVWRSESALWENTISVSPNSPRAHYNLGIAYADRGLIDKAIEEYKGALSASPNFSKAHYNLGIAYEDKGLIDKAIEEYKKALKSNPAHFKAHYNLGILYENKKLINEAIREYREALKLKPDDPEAHNNLGNVYKDKGLIDKAIEEYKKALKINPAHFKAHYNLGIALANKGLIDKAIEEFKEVLKINPDHFKSHYKLGVIYSDKKLFKNAIEEYRSALRINPNIPTIHNELGIAYKNEGLFDKAIEEYREALKLKPDFSEVHNNLGNVYLFKGEIDNAVEEYKKALQLNPNLVSAWNNLKMIMKRRGSH